MNVEMTRRKLLKGIGLGAGAAVLSPLLDHRALAGGNAQRANPKRVVFVIQSNGFLQEHAVPTGIVRTVHNPMHTTARIIDESLRNKDFHPALEALTPFKNRIGLIQNLSNRIAYSDHSCRFGVLGCAPKNDAHGPSVDQLVADALPAPFKHVALGYSESGDCYHISASAARRPVPIIASPLDAFRSLFGTTTEAGVRSFDARTNILDFMAGDAARSRTALAGAERQKLDSYVSSFETLRDRQASLLAMRDAMRRNAPRLNEAALADRPNASTILTAHFDIAAAALIAGMTNVVTLVSGGNDFGKWPELGVPDLHGLGHGATFEGRTWSENFTRIRQFHTRLIAELAGKLQAVREGNGTMLDNTVIIYQSDSADGHHPSCYNNPMVVLGNLGGTLRTDGRYLEFPGYTHPGHRTMASFYCTLLHAVGAPRDRFGSDDVRIATDNQRGPIRELLS